MKINKLFVSVLVLIAVLAAGCGGSGSENGENGSSSGKVFEIKSSDGSTVGKIDLGNGAPSVEAGGVVLKSKMHGEKRKWNSSNGSTEVSIKYKEDAIKLKRDSGELLWKVKYTADKIKVSDNEENANPWEIKPMEEGRSKLKKNEEEIGDARLRTEKGIIEISSAAVGYTIEATEYSRAWPVMLIDQVPLTHRLIIIAELMLKGQ